MTDWIDRSLGDFCDSVSNEIRDLPFLAPGYKDEAMGWLKDCVKEAKADTRDTVVSFAERFDTYRSEFVQRTGHRFQPALNRVQRIMTGAE